MVSVQVFVATDCVLNLHPGAIEEGGQESRSRAEERRWASRQSREGTASSTSHPDIVLFSLLPGGLEGGLQEEASRGHRYDAAHHDQQREHQRESPETMDQRRDLHLHWRRAHLSQPIQRSRSHFAADLANLIEMIYRSRDIYRGNATKISRQESSRGSSSCLQYRGNVVLQHECLP